MVQFTLFIGFIMIINSVMFVTRNSFRTEFELGTNFFTQNLIVFYEIWIRYKRHFSSFFSVSGALYYFHCHAALYRKKHMKEKYTFNTRHYIMLVLVTTIHKLVNLDRFKMKKCWLEHNWVVLLTNTKVVAHSGRHMAYWFLYPNTIFRYYSFSPG